MRFRLEYVDEQLADGLALDLGIGDASERVEKQRVRLDVDERDIVAVVEQRHHLLRFGEAQQSVIDEHAGELLADRLVDQHRGDRGIDAAGQPADHPAFADLRANLLDRLLLEGAHGPVALAARDPAHEIAQQRRTLRRVHDLEVELGGVELPSLVRDHRNRRIGRGADHAEAHGQPGHAVAVAHPDRIALALAPHALEQGRILGHQHLGTAELAVMPALDQAAELLRHRLLAVADAEDRHARDVDLGRRKRRVRLEHRGGSARQDHALRPQRPERLLGFLERHDLAIDSFFADPPCNELGHLRAEIDDENLVVAGEPVRTGAAREGGIEQGHLQPYVRPMARPVKAPVGLHHRLATAAAPATCPRAAVTGL